MNRQTLNDAEWKRAVKYFSAPNQEIYLNAESIMDFAVKTPDHHDEVVSLAGEYLDHPTSEQASYAKEGFALFLLRRGKSPRWRAECEKRVNSSDQFVRDMAKQCLKKGDPK